MSSLTRKISAAILILIGIGVYFSSQNWGTFLLAVILSIIAVILILRASDSD